MKLNLYMDVWPGWDGRHANASTSVSYEKMPTSTRFKIVVDVPEWAYQTKSDAVLPVVEFVEVDKEQKPCPNQQ